MTSRFTITAALAAAVAIVTVAACGSSVTGSAQPNAAAAATAATAPGSPSSSTSPTSTIPTTTSRTSTSDTTTSRTSSSDTTTSRTSSSDTTTSRTSTSATSSLPTDLTVPTDFTVPTDLSLPSDLSELTNLSIPGYSGECLSVSSAYAGVTLAMIPVFFGGTESFNAGDLQKTLDSLSGNVPAEIAPDLQAIADLAAQSNGKSMTDAAALLQSDQFTTAQNHIEQWLTAHCNG